MRKMLRLWIALTVVACGAPTGTAPPLADGGGMSATVMTAEGTWSGTTGKADGVRDLQIDDQFAAASITKRSGPDARCEPNWHRRTPDSAAS